MLSYCFKWRKEKESKNSRVPKTKIMKISPLTNMCGV